MAQGDTYRGILSTTFERTNEKRDVSEMIDYLSPYDTPFFNLVGRDSLRAACDQVKHEWMEDQLPGWYGTLLSAYVAGSGTMIVNTSQGKFLVPDDQIVVGNAVYRVEAGAPDSDTLVVEWLGGAADAAAAAGVEWRRLAHAAQEGGEARNDTRKTVPGMPYNYTQIVKDWIVVTGTMEKIKRYGYASERSYQEEQVLRLLAISLEQQLLYGARSFEEGPPRRSTMGGLLEYVLKPGIASSWTTVLNAATADFTETMLNNMLQAIWEKGGRPDFISVNGVNRRRVTQWGIPRIRTTQGERRAGASFAVYDSDFGSVDIMLVRFQRPSDIIFGSRGNMGLGPLNGRQFSSRLLPSTGDYTRYEILGEYTMEVHKPTVEWGWIHNTSTTY